MRIPYTCTNANDHFCNYYLKQAVYGLPAYAGSRHQKGQWFFSNLFRSAIPLLKRGDISLARHLFKTGSNVVNDVEAGESLRESARRRFIKILKGVINLITGNQALQGYKNRIKVL